MAEKEGESIKVYIRVRPVESYEDTPSSTCSTCIEVTTPTTITINSKPDPKVFTFDHVASPNATQESVFKTVGRPIIDGCMNGYNGTIFAYGQTGSGKTFTMIGPSEEDDGDIYSHQLRGVIPRCFEYLFNLINREKLKYGEMIQFLCKCSFLEIYNEHIYDLLDQSSTGLHLRENMKRGVYVDGIIEEVVTTATETYQVLSNGWINRRVAATSMNRESSRSHAVFMLTVESKLKESSDGVCKIRSSTLNLIDLAGSERQKDTLTDGIRLKEAGNINRSLSVLGSVITSLVDISNGKQRHIHYRDSKLTFLLRDSLGGNARTSLIANVHPLSKCFGETLSTLQFARRTKMIKNKVCVNEDMSGNVMQLQNEIKKLKELLSRTVAPPPVGMVSGCGHEETETLQEMLCNSIKERERVEEEKMQLLEKNGKLQELCKRKEKSLQSLKMILKLRDAHIAKLESKDPPTIDDVIKQQREEIVQLKCYIDHHPQVMRFAAENIELRAEVKRLKSLSGDDKGVELTRLQQYTRQLESQLRGCVTKETDSSVAAETSKLNGEIERLHLQCQKLHEELNRAQDQLRMEREDNKSKIFELETSLKTAKKNIKDLECTIDSLRVSHSLSRDVTNDTNIKTIHAVATPLLKRCKSVTSTPLGGGEKRRQFFSPLLFQPVKKQLLVTEEEEEEKEEKEEEKEEEEEEEKEEFKNDTSLSELLENLKTLTNDNNELMNKLEFTEVQLQVVKSEKESLLLKLSESKDYYETRLKELLEEQKRNEDKLREGASTNDMLRGEVSDLKLCLQSADRELVEVKKEKEREKVNYETESADLLLKLQELEFQLTSKTCEVENNIKLIQGMENELETLRAETSYKDHLMTEKEKENHKTITTLKSNLQHLEDMVAMETDKAERLLLERAGSQDELGTALNENSKLMKEITAIKNEYEKKLLTLSDEFTGVQAKLSLVESQSGEQQLVINQLTSSLQSLRDDNTRIQTENLSLKEELREKETHLLVTMATNEDQVNKLDSLLNEVTLLKDKHNKEMEAKDIQCEVLVEEVEYLQGQVDEFNNKLIKMEEESEEKKENITSMKHQLSVKDDEIQQLKEYQKEKESMLEQVKCLSDDDDVIGFFESQTERLLTLESDKAQYSLLVSELEDINKNNNDKIRELESQLIDYETLQREHEILQTQLVSLKYKLECDHEEHVNSERELEKGLQLLVEQNDLMETKLNTLTSEKENINTILEETLTELKSYKEKLLLTEEQLNRLQEQELLNYKEKEELKSSLEIIMEEKAKLLKEHQDIVKENALLSGHRNLKQRIHFHAELKEKYHKLLEDYRQLEEKLQLNQATVSQALSTTGSCKEDKPVQRMKLREKKENINKVV